MQLAKNLVLKETIHGPILYRTNDMYLGRCLELYGEFSVFERDVFRKYINPKACALDVGANIGVHTVEMSRIASAVVSIEMEPQLFQMMCANVALNDRFNVVTVNAAVGAYEGMLNVPRIDFNDDGNFGCLSATGHASGDPVKLITIDSLKLNNCGFMKIDVEGMELDALKGARYTIKRFNPIIYMENDRREKSAELIDMVQRLGYRPYWHLPTLYNPDNYLRNAENVFPGISSINMLCMPDDRIPEFPVFKINKPTDWWESIVVKEETGEYHYGT